MPANLAAARDAANAFRAKYITGMLFDRFPLDTVFIADNVLRLDLVSFPGLEGLCNSTAYITAGMTEMYLDEALYSAYDSRHYSISKKNRLRFSVAHEIGHLTMHNGIIDRIRCRSIEELKRIANNDDDDRKCIEKEANEFAGRLIAPAEELKRLVDTYGHAQSNPRWRDDGRLRSEFATHCCKTFGLHEDGIRTRLDRDGIWPSDWVSGGG